MIEAILNDAKRDGNIADWRRRLSVRPWRIAFHDGDVLDYTRDEIIDFCTNLAIARGEIPDPHGHVET